LQFPGIINKNVGRKPTTCLQHCLCRGVDGVIIACVDFNDPMVQELVNSSLPVVTIDHVFNDRVAVVSDNVAVMMIPPQVSAVGYIQIMYKLKLTNNYPPLILPVAKEMTVPLWGGRFFCGG